MPRILVALVCSAAVALAGCASGVTSSAPSASASTAAGAGAVASTGAPTITPRPTPTASPTSVAIASPTASPTASPSAEATPQATASRAADPCRPTKKAGTVAVKIVDFAFSPKAIKARVGQVITFRNTGFESHAPTLDAFGCKTPTLDTGQSAGLVFSAAGTFAFHCVIHGWMTGTITIKP